MNPGLNRLNLLQAAEPTTGLARAPIWMWVLVAVLAFWGLGFLDNHAGGFNPQVYVPYNSVDEWAGDRRGPGGPDPSGRGRRVFAQNCAQCHGESGLGSPATQVPPLVHSEWVLGGPKRLIRIVLNGLQGPVDVNGKHFESSAMFAWRDILSDADVAVVLTFLRGNKDWGHHAPPITAEQVAQIRAEPNDRAGQWTARELLNAPE